MKKLLIKCSLIICLLCACFMFVNTASADSFSANTLIYTYYNDMAEYYDNLAGISQFSINSKYIAYTLDQTNVIIVNIITKQSFSLQEYNLTFNQIQDITLTKNFLFVSDFAGLGAYNLKDFSKIDLVTSTNSTPLGKFKSYSIFDNGDKIIIACINDYEFISYTYSTNNLKFKSTYTNTALNSAIHTKRSSDNEFKLLNVVTTDTKAYIINNSTNSSSSSLWEINYSSNTQFKTALFPKPNITSLVLHTSSENNTDYLLAIDNKNNIYVLKTNLQYNENEKDIDLADQTRNGNSTDSRFVINDISNPEDIVEYNGKIYISDSGTKCIQEFAFELTNDQKGSIVGKNILVASECGEIGRFNQNSNIDFANNTLVVADSTNRRIQKITDGVVTNYDSKIFESVTNENLDNLNTAHIVGNKIIFTSYNNSNSQQNIFEYTKDTNSLIMKPHSLARIFDSVISGNYIYYVCANGLYSYNTITGSTANINNIVYSTQSRIAILDNTIIITNQQSINTYTLQGNQVSGANIADNILDITIDNTNIYLLHSDSISKYNIVDNNITLVSSLPIGANNSDFYSITIDKSTGILYLFDNTDCKIVKIINPTFNYKENRAIFQVNNKNVCVYNQPYFLNGIDSPQIITKLNVNDRVNIYSKTSLNYGNIEYYMIELEDNTFGYINKNDLTYLSEVVNFEVIHPNASLRAFDDSNTINVYSQANINSEVTATAPVGTRVLILDESNPNFILVKYYDQDQNIVTGYIIANQVNHDAITPSQKTSLMLVGCSVALLLSIMIILSIIYKKKRKKNI